MDTTYTAGDGKTHIRLTVTRYLDVAMATSYINGRKDMSGRPMLLDTPRGTIVAYLGRVGLTQSRYDEVITAIDALQAQIDAEPAVQERTLRAHREDLQRAIALAVAAWHDDRTAAISQMSATGIGRASMDTSAETAARAALTAFDAAHPELVAALAIEAADASARMD